MTNFGVPVTNAALVNKLVMILIIGWGGAWSRCHSMKEVINGIVWDVTA